MIHKATHESNKDDASSEPVNAARSPLPFPQRLQKKNDGRMFNKFLSMLSLVQLNIPLVDVLHEIPKYAKYIKDRSIGYPEGVIENVLLQIGKFIFPSDFIILDYEADEQVPIILGRTVMATCDSIVKVREGKMIMRMDNEEVVFNSYKAIQLPCHYEEFSMISVVEVDGKLINMSVYLDDSLEKALMLFDSLEIDDKVEEMMHNLDASYTYIHRLNPFEPLNRPSGTPPKLLIEEAPKLDLKLQEEKLVRVLREHIRAIGWTMSDIRGIIASFCMYKILMAEGHKPSVEQQCCLNPIIKEVLRKEVIKWLDTMLLEKDTLFKFDDACMNAFEKLKGRLVIGPIIIAPDWAQPFELMCDATDIAIRVVLGQRRDKVFHSIYYVRKTLNPAQMNYTITEKECQIIGTITKKHEMPLQNILAVELFDVWEIYFIGPFPYSNGHKHILAAVGYMSKRVESIALPTNDANVVVKFVKKHIFTRFGTPRVLISDRGTHFCNKLLNNVLVKYGFKNKVTTVYHPQTSGQAKVSNKEVKHILEKTVSGNRKDWAAKLDDALWAYGTAYKTPIGPFVVVSVRSHGAVELRDMSSSGTFLVNGQRVKHYWGGDIARHKTSVDLASA
uniref:Integrase catalytic domain-containing protein n=1 Tax=Nicotiana tabacum TaxID=4097 RepID=A0A1S4A9T0_TOBAC|nr:PREDICTED: uncharacterized protein LOC107795262 [Nicotiana tabacum]